MSSTYQHYFPLLSFLGISVVGLLYLIASYLVYVETIQVLR